MQQGTAQTSSQSENQPQDVPSTGTESDQLQDTQPAGTEQPQEAPQPETPSQDVKPQGAAQPENQPQDMQSERTAQPENQPQDMASAVQSDATQEIQTTQSDAAQILAQPEAEPAQTLTTPQYYVVRKGDTLRTICYEIYGDYSRVEEICQWNQIENPDNILYGQKLLLP